MNRSFKMFRYYAGIAGTLALLLSAPASAESYTDEQLKSFVVAVSTIDQIALRWQAQIQGAATEDQAAEMIKQADEEMRQAIDNTSSIGMDDYQNILQTAQSDPVLRSRIETIMKDVAPK